MSTPYADTDNMAPAAPESQWALLRRGRFLLLWAGQLTGLIGDSFNYVAVAWLVLQLTGSSLAVGSVLTAAAVPRALLMLVGGAVIDRFSPRTTMVAAGFVRAAAMGTLAGLAIAHAVTLPELFVGAFLIGAISAFFIPAPPALLARVVADGQLEAGNAMMQLNGAIGAIAGPALAGVVVAAFGAGPALLGDAGGYALAGAFALLVPGVARTASAGKGSPLVDIAEGIALVWRDVPLRVAWVLIAVFSLVILGALEVGLPVLANRQLHGPISFGLIFTASAWPRRWARWAPAAGRRRARSAGSWSRPRSGSAWAWC